MLMLKLEHNRFNNKQITLIIPSAKQTYRMSRPPKQHNHLTCRSNRFRRSRGRLSHSGNRIRKRRWRVLIALSSRPAVKFVDCRVLFVESNQFARILFTGRLMVVRVEWIMHTTMVVVGGVQRIRVLQIRSGIVEHFVDMY